MYVVIRPDEELTPKNVSGFRIAKAVLLMIVFAAAVSCRQREIIHPLDTGDVPALVKASDLIVLGTVSTVQDGTARDAGMSYGVVVKRILHGSSSSDFIDFTSPGRVGYARYEEGEDVILFLTRFGSTWPTLRTVVMDGRQIVCYVRDGIVQGPFGRHTVEEYARLIREAGEAQ